MCRYPAMTCEDRYCAEKWKKQLEKPRECFGSCTPNRNHIVLLLKLMIYEKKHFCLCPAERLGGTCVFHRLRDFTVVKHICTWCLSLLFLNIKTQLFPPTMSGYSSKWVMNRVWLGSCACKLGNYFRLLVNEIDGRHSAWLYCTAL